MTSIRIAAPDRAALGEVIELKALIQHDMESGYRLDSRGEKIPRNILTKFECVYAGDVVFEADFYPGVAANPLISFYTRAVASGEIRFQWTEQTGQVFSRSVQITVE